jgi:hypothetical protein
MKQLFLVILVTSTNLLITRVSGFLSCVSRQQQTDASPSNWKCALQTSSNSEEAEREVDEKVYQSIDIDAVSDAEALLAVRAYLQRKNRLGSWSKYEERKRQARQSISSMQNASSRSVDEAGFFWEDPAQLRYLYHDSEASKTISSRHDDSEADLSEMEETDETLVLPVDGEAKSRTDTELLDFPMDEEDFDADATADSFFDHGPSDSRIRRSKAARKTWSNPDWRKMWYERRWGERRRQRVPGKQEQKIMEDRVRTFNPDQLLGSEALSSLTEGEIADAICSYVGANRKRSFSRQISLQERKAALQKPPSIQALPRDYLLQQDPAVLIENRRKRARRASQAYQKRLDNESFQRDGQRRRQASAKRAADGKASARTISQARTPDAALQRITADLDDERIPAILDVELILEPIRLGRRKDVLRRILSVCFDLRGKCVPDESTLEEWNNAKEDTAESVEPYGFVFATSCSIDHLGKFVLYCVQKAHRELPFFVRK